MTTKARKLADLGNAYDDGALSNRNLIINGAMQVAQRGTSYSFSSGNALYTTVDRFEQAYFGTWGSNHSQITQATDAPDDFDRSLKFTALTAQDYSSALGSWIQYTFENQDIVRLKNGSGLKEFTVSFWVKASKTGNVTVSFENAYSYSTYVTITSANTWEYKTVVIPATSNNMGIDYSGTPNGGGLKLKFGMGSNGAWLVSTDNQWNDVSTSRGVLSPQQTNFNASVGDTFQITGVQLEVGDTATPFEHRSYGDELARCQRYFDRINGTAGGGFITTANWSTTDAFGGYTYRVPMRTTPTFSVSDNSHFSVWSAGGNDVCTNISLNGDSDCCHLPFTVASGLVTGESSWVRFNTTGYLSFDAEL